MLLYGVVTVNDKAKGGESTQSERTKLTKNTKKGYEYFNSNRLPILVTLVSLGCSSLGRFSSV